MDKRANGFIGDYMKYPLDFVTYKSLGNNAGKFHANDIDKLRY